MTALAFFAGLLAWLLIGCFVLTYLDRPKGMNGRLIKWAEQSPAPGWGLAAWLWPVILYMVITLKPDSEQ
jgi:hypothetical protein